MEKCSYEAWECLRALTQSRDCVTVRLYWSKHNPYKHGFPCWSVWASLCDGFYCSIQHFFCVCGAPGNNAWCVSVCLWPYLPDNPRHIFFSAPSPHLSVFDAVFLIHFHTVCTAHTTKQAVLNVVEPSNRYGYIFRKLIHLTTTMDVVNICCLHTWWMFWQIQMMSL